MLVAVCGSRAYPDTSRVASYIESICNQGLKIITGDAGGVDSVARSTAKRLNIPVTEIRADWSKNGKRAGMMRNPDIIKPADKVAIFITEQNGELTHGSMNDLEIALENGKPLEVFPLKVVKTINCNVCGWWLDYLLEGQWIDNHVEWGDVAQVCCCGLTYYYSLEWDVEWI